MSAIRGTDRRAARSHNSSPYARQVPKKKSSWSFGIGDILSYINPLRSRHSPESEDEDTNDSEEIIEDPQASAQPDVVPSSTSAAMGSPNNSSVSENPQVPQNPAVSLSARGHQLANNSQQTPERVHANAGLMFSTPPRVAPTDDAQLSPAESLEKVHSFLKEKDGQPLSEWETRGLLTFLEKNVQGDHEKREPFRFSSSPSRTPRDNSPVFGFGIPDASTATNGDPTTPRKTLSKNPNGIYRWQGGGSARPRNRYQSPSFGTRTQPPTIKLSPAKTDTKRRRVGDDAEKSSSQQVPFPAVSPQKPATETEAASPSAPTPAPSQTHPNIFPTQNGTSTTLDGAAAPKTNGASAPRLRTSGLPTKPTAPTVPSPLRQTWGQSDSPPQTPPSKANPTPTKAASFMTELIKEVTPPKKPDLSNPYQTASPVKPPPRKPVVKRPRAPAKPAAPPPAPVKAPEPSPQAIIEATVPKGSKRSRPPPELFKSTRADPTPVSTPAPPRRSPRSQSSDLPSMNGFTSTSGIARATEKSPVVVEVIDDDDDNDNRAPKKQKTNYRQVTVEEIDDIDTPLSSQKTTSFLRPSEIVEPFDNGGSSSSKPAQPASSFATTSSIKPAFAGKFSAPKEPSKLRFSYQADKADLPHSTPTAPPSSSFSPPPTPRFTPAKLPTVFRGHETVDPKQSVIAMAVYDLPTYEFPLQSSIQPKFDYSADAQEAAKAEPVASLPVFDFSAPLETTSLSNGFNWAAAAAPMVESFDWAAAGAKPPSTAQGTWTCSLCMISNSEAANKCIACDTTR